MKKSVFIIISLLSFLFLSVQASNKIEAKNSSPITLDTSTEYQTIRVATKVPTGLKNAVTNELFYPKDAQDKNLEGQVYLRLCIDENSYVKIVSMNATTPYLGEYVKKQLASTYVKKPGCEPGQVYLMKVNFDLLSQ